jgi:ABC-type transport system substrate-binding protein
LNSATWGARESSPSAPCPDAGRRRLLALLGAALAPGSLPHALAAKPNPLVPGPVAADQPKVLHAFLSTSETGMDPAVASDLATLSVIENLFDPLLRYDYLARPARLAANTAVALPEVADGGTTYLFRIRPGILFSPHPVFEGRPRELTAYDYVYSLKRLYDPRLKSPWLFLFDGKLLGDAALKRPDNGDIHIAGLSAPDRYTLRLRLNAPDPTFPYCLATPASSAVAREVAQAYGAQAGNHPVGTGPFRLARWKRSDTLLLEAQRAPHHRYLPDEAGRLAQPAVAAALEGRQLPLVDRVELRVAEEFQGRVLGFLNGEFDYLEQVPESLADMVLRPGAGGTPELKPELAARGVRLARVPVLQTYYLWFNMHDPVLGGYARPQLALRRALALAYHRNEDVQLMKRGLALSAQSPLPPGVQGYDPAYRSPVQHDLRLANALLDRYGYRRGAEGLRQRPGGAPLTLRMHSEATVTGRLRDEFWRRQFGAIGLRVEFISDKKTEIIKASRLGKVQMFETNWIADIPDGDNFYQLLYGPNAGRANYARFDLAAYNQRYEAARRLAPGAERQRLFTELNQLIHAWNPWIPLTHPLSADLQHPWLKHAIRHPVSLTAWRYLDIDVAMQQQGRRRARK